MKLRNIVEQVLQEVPDSRNDDMVLTIWVWWKIAPEKFVQIENEKYIRMKDLLDLPREGDIKRIRAIIQNDEGLYLPTDPKVITKRKKRQENWREEICNS